MDNGSQGGSQGADDNVSQKSTSDMDVETKRQSSASTATITSIATTTSSSSAPSSSTAYYPQQSNQDLAMYYDVRSSDYPENVLKVFKPDQTYKFLLVHKETTAHEVVMLALQEFGMHDPSSNFSLCEVSVCEGGMIKQRRLPEQLQSLAERIGLNSRYYLKTNGISETLVPDEMASELIRDGLVHFLQLNPNEIAVQLTNQDFQIFRQIESTEYIDDLFQINSKYSTPMLNKVCIYFSNFLNKFFNFCY